MEKKPLNLLQMINVNAGMLGIQFAWALQIANTSFIYAFFGAKYESLGYFWFIFLLAGMVVQPIVGYLSDITWTRIGRRRPYILIGTIITCLTLVLIPNVNSLKTVVMLLTLFSISINIAMQPYHALIADIIPGIIPKESALFAPPSAQIIVL